MTLVTEPPPPPIPDNGEAQLVVIIQKDLLTMRDCDDGCSEGKLDRGAWNDTNTVELLIT
jgi:hypothetical protein